MTGNKLLKNVRFALVSLHIDLCWSFKAKSYFYIYIRYIYIWFVNSFCRYILKRTWVNTLLPSQMVSNISIKHGYFNLLWIIFLHAARRFQVLLSTSNNVTSITCLQTTKWSQVLLFNINHFIQHYSFICIQLQVFLFATNNLIKQPLLVYTVKWSKSLILTVQWKQRNSLNEKEFYLTHKLDSISVYHYGPE